MCCDVLRVPLPLLLPLSLLMRLLLQLLPVLLLMVLPAMSQLQPTQAATFLPLLLKKRRREAFRHTWPHPEPGRGFGKML
jgi:hypothetical protein